MRSVRLAALAATAYASALVGCLPDPGPFYPRPNDSTLVSDSPVGGGDGPPARQDTGQPPGGDGPVVRQDTGVPPKPDTSAAPTFTQVFNQVIAPNCSCHDAASHSSTLIMRDPQEAYGNLVGVPARGGGPCGGNTRVVAGDSNGSVFWGKLDGGGTLCGARMPRGGARLPQNLIDLVRDWIDGGAKQ